MQKQIDTRNQKNDYTKCLALLIGLI